MNNFLLKKFLINIIAENVGYVIKFVLNLTLKDVRMSLIMFMLLQIKISKYFKRALPVVYFMNWQRIF